MAQQQRTYHDEHRYRPNEAKPRRNDPGVKQRLEEVLPQVTAIPEVTSR